MKTTLLIEKVTNGYLVRPFTTGEAWIYQDPKWVYRNIEDLQQGLPFLLGEIDKENDKQDQNTYSSQTQCSS